MTLLSYLYGIITDRAISAPGYGRNFVHGINATEKCYLKQQSELIGKLGSNETSNIGMLPGASSMFTLNLQSNVYAFSIIMIG